MAVRTFKVRPSPMRGRDIAEWQAFLRRQLRETWQVDHPIKVDGVYGVATRDATATVLHGLGIAQERMARGVTPWLRVKVRRKRLSKTELARYRARADWRRRLRERYAGRGVAPPFAKVTADSWGWTPPGHDGLDLIVPARAPIHSMCDGIVLRADPGGWWGKAPSGNVALGDGIIVIECTIAAGPFRPGLRICYGHAESPRVRVGDRVRAGEVIGEAGLAVAWHVHLMVHGRNDARGVGDRDPRPFYEFARARG